MKKEKRKDRAVQRQLAGSTAYVQELRKSHRRPGMVVSMDSLVFWGVRHSDNRGAKRLFGEFLVKKGEVTKNSLVRCPRKQGEGVPPTGRKKNKTQQRNNPNETESKSNVQMSKSGKATRAILPCRTHVGRETKGDRRRKMSLCSIRFNRKKDGILEDQNPETLDGVKWGHLAFSCSLSRGSLRKGGASIKTLMNEEGKAEIRPPIITFLRITMGVRKGKTAPENAII